MVRISRPVRPACWAEASSITPTSRPGLGRSANLRPEMVAVPEVGEVRPTIIRIEVDLPARSAPGSRSPGPSGDEADVVDDGGLPYFFDNESMVIMGERLSSMSARSGSCCDSLRSSACLDARKCGGVRVVVRLFPCPTTRRRTPPPQVGGPPRPVTFCPQIRPTRHFRSPDFGRPVTFCDPRGQQLTGQCDGGDRK